MRARSTRARDGLVFAILCAVIGIPADLHPTVTPTDKRANCDSPIVMITTAAVASTSRTTFAGAMRSDVCRAVVSVNIAGLAHVTGQALGEKSGQGARPTGSRRLGYVETDLNVVCRTPR